MYKHHEESLQILVDYFQGQKNVIALIFGGSVAKGLERPDSDLDAMVVVTPELYEEKKNKGITAESIEGMCTYEGGYFDIKYLTKEYLQAAAVKGSEPTRNAFISSRVLFSSDPEIETIVNAIPVFQTSEMEDKQLSFYSALMLNYMYFWKDCKPEGYMKTHVAAEIVYTVYRMILQENHILFPSNRRLEETVMHVKRKPEGIAQLAGKFCSTYEDDACDSFVKTFLDWTSYHAPKDSSICQSRYVEDYETWWLKPRPLVNEW